MGRFALYQDFKDLYSKVVPVVSDQANRISGFAKQIAQFDKIILKLDQNLNLRALKTDISDVIIQLNKRLKKQSFDQQMHTIQTQFEQHD
jgi:hypothetical protein